MADHYEVLGVSRDATPDEIKKAYRRLARELKRLMEQGHNLSFGVITFYAAQEVELWKALVREGLAEQIEDGSYRVAAAWRETRDAEGKLSEWLRVGTVDAFQGREKEAVLVSLTRSNAEGALGFLNDLRRINVALTRARRHLFVVGDSATLSGHTFYARFIERMQQTGIAERQPVPAGDERGQHVGPGLHRERAEVRAP